jgi:hypothetical protein
MAYRTGGTNTFGAGKGTTRVPERGMLPGYQKDVYAYGYDFPFHIMAEAENKMNTLPRAIWELSQNKDYRGDPIYKPQYAGDVKGQPASGLLDYLIDLAMPISFSQVFGKKDKGSKISEAERLAGIRAAPRYLEDTKGEEQTEKHFADQDWQKRVRADQRKESRTQ